MSKVRDSGLQSRNKNLHSVIKERKPSVRQRKTVGSLLGR